MKCEKFLLKLVNLSEMNLESEGCGSSCLPYPQFSENNWRKEEIISPMEYCSKKVSNISTKLDFNWRGLW